jgi:membrane protease YdiL (CAAX protease family)
MPDFKPMFWAIGYYFIILLLILGFSTLNVSPLVLKFGLNILFLVVTLAVAYTNLNELRPLYQIRRINPLVVILVIILSILFSSALNLTIPHVNNWIFKTDSESNLYTQFLGLRFPIFFMVLSMAVIPAVLEEMAFRGFVFNQMETYMSSRTAIIVCSFLFAILHLNVFSLFWIFPIALVWGWLRIKYNTVWYGMISHFFVNFTSTMFDLNEVEHFLF